MFCLADFESHFSGGCSCQDTIEDNGQLGDLSEPVYCITGQVGVREKAVLRLFRVVLLLDLILQ